MENKKNISSEWVVVKKEVELDQNGQPQSYKTIYEIPKKGGNKISTRELVDYAIRIVGMLSIFIPLYLFYKQQYAEKIKTDRFKKIEIFTDATVNLHSFERISPFDLNYELVSDNILYNVFSKISFIGDLELEKEIKSTQNLINFTQFIKNRLKKSEITDSILSTLYELETKNWKIYDSVFSNSTLGEDFSRLREDLREVYVFCKSSDPFIKRYALLFDTLISNQRDLIYLSQNIYLRDSISATDIWHIPDMSIESFHFIEDFTNEYKTEVNQKVYKLDSLMKCSINKMPN